MLVKDVAALLLAYLVGSVPMAHLITRWRIGLSIRQVGIGNAGARNVWHMVGPTWGALVAVLDGAKGLCAVLLARSLGASITGVVLAGPAAILGHDFPVFLRFQGGKGLATTVGILLAWMPGPTLISMAVTAAAQMLTHNFDRSIVFGSAVAIILPPFLGYPWTMSLYVLCLLCGLWVRKLQDRSHQRRVWQSSGWQDVEESDWYGPSSAAGDEGTVQREAHTAGQTE